MFDLQDELKKLPDLPGVYIMHDKSDAIIYIGKALSLRKRVRQYFQPSHNEGIKKKQMVEHIERFEYIITDSELEALVLECNLIKEHTPKYNTMLRDDKTYPYIRVTVGEDFPRVLFSRQMKKDKSRYFGPYTSAGAVKDTIDLINKIYRLRTCNRNLPRDIGLDRACLNYHIHQCDAPCQGYISKEEYAEKIQGVLEFLNGNYGPVIRDLEAKMNQASMDMEFEKAIEYRELLSSVKQIAQKQKITNTDGEDKDIIALAADDVDAVVQVFFIRSGKLIGRDHFHIRVGTEETRSDILSTFIKQFYSGTPFIPREILLQEAIEEASLVEEWLGKKRGTKVTIHTPQKGMKNKLVELAARNAQMVLDQDKEKIKREEGRTIGAVKEIEGLLGLKGLNRMEAFDISNINGFETVGSMVVYEKGKPKRSDYRKFKLRTVTGPDDYASMHEVLTRRFLHGLEEQSELESKELPEEVGAFNRFPDIIMMDGGRGQVNICLQVLEELGLDIPVCGMVKDDNHRTRG
ncbi:MAG: excinuclease ABC subunit UvrC, partial [Agathobacter sp.]|nr:excinuclease ABC subunit UvrC [Agathobacter sp.]